MANTKLPPELVDDQVFGNRNVIINGEMQVAQRGTQTGMGASTAFTAVDRMNIAFSQTSGRVTSEQSTDTPDGFANSVKLSCTTADTSLASAEYVIFRQKIEGFNLQRFAKGTSSAKEFTVSFYVKGNASATYNCELYDADNTRQINKQFAVTTSWNRIELTFPADTTGAFDNDANASLFVQIWLAAGSGFQGTTANTTWSSVTDNTKRANGSSNFLSSTSNTFFITGFQLETGSQATPFEHRSIGEQLALCQRYYVELTSDQQTNPIMNCGYYNTTAIYGAIIFPTEMRTEPTMEQTAGTDFFRVYSTGAEDKFTGFNAIHSVTPQRVVIAAVSTQGISGTQSAAGWVETRSTAARLAFTAEL